MLVLLGYRLVAPVVVAERAWAETRARGVLRVGIDPAGPPFSYLDDRGWNGFDADLAAELGQRLNLKIEPVLLGFDARYDGLAADIADVVISEVSVDPSQTETAAYSIAYLDAGLRAVSPIPDDTLVNRCVFVALGSEADEHARYLERRTRNMTRVAVADEARALTQALSTRDCAGVALVDALAGIRNGCPLVDPARPASPTTCRVLRSKPYVIAVPRTDARLLREIDATLQTLRDDGTLDRLVARWLR
jgi:ABC-type amino acid transport substrate-binding protein